MSNSPIKYAALKFILSTDDGNEREIIMTGYDHAQCFESAYHVYEKDFYYRDKTRDTQGFMTVNDVFLDRFEAAKVAKEHNQLRPGIADVERLESHQLTYQQK